MQAPCVICCLIAYQEYEHVVPFGASVEVTDARPLIRVSTKIGRPRGPNGGLTQPHVVGELLKILTFEHGR